MVLFCIIAILLFLILMGAAVVKDWFLILFVCSSVSFLVFTVIALICAFSGNELGYIFGILALISLINMLKALFGGRCPQCKKFFKSRRTGKNLIQQGDVFYQGNGKDRTAYQKNLYQLDYACCACQHEWSKTKAEKERVE